MEAQQCPRDDRTVNHKPPAADMESMLPHELLSGSKDSTLVELQMDLDSATSCGSIRAASSM